MMLNPMGVFSVSLLTSLVLSLPSLMACLQGRLGLPVAGLRFLVAFTLCRFAFGALARLATTYHLMAQARAVAAQADGSEPVSEGTSARGSSAPGASHLDRRKTDRPVS